MPLEPRSFRAAGWIGIVGALATAVSDLALQYTPEASHLASRDYLYLLDVAPGRLLLGHFLGVFGILLEIAGFWQVSLGLRPAGRVPARSFFFLSAGTFALGTAFHAMFAPIGLALHALQETGAAPALLSAVAAAVRPAHQGLGAVILTGIAALSLLFSWLVVFRPTLYPRWMALCSPLPLALFFLLLTRFSLTLRLVLLPCGLNLANLVLFGLSTAVLGRARDARPGTAGSSAARSRPSSG
ncbi:MAG TPA: DUF6796 family protein [Thermoanaerobaculia bacterium]|nr:DUF6796 family protein [Thermoanaerobaculia bacterium]